MRKEILLLGLMLFLPSLAFATQDTLFWIQGELFDSATMTPLANRDMSVDIFTTATCSGSPYWTGTFPSTTDVNGVYSMLISNISMDFNQNYYACIYANGTLINSAIQFRAGQGQVNEFDVDFTNLNITNDLTAGGDITADYLYGDGSGLTNITADDLDINDNEWLYLNTNDTIGLRYNSSGTGNIEMNHRLYVPNMISANSIDASLGYFDYLQMGYKGYSTGNPFTVINTTGTQKLSIDFDGDITFLDDTENNYITWNESGIGAWKYSPTQHALEMWAGFDTEDYIALYNPTEIWGNLTMVSGNVSADYFIGDGSLLTNLPTSAQYWNRTGTTLYPATAGDDVNVTGDLTVDYDIFLKDSSTIYLTTAQDEYIAFTPVNLGSIAMSHHVSIPTDMGYCFGDPLNADCMNFNNTTSARFEFSDNIYSSENITADYFFGNLNWSYIQNAPSFITSETDPIWTANSSTVARIGNCPAGQVVINTTTSGVQCAIDQDKLWNRTGTTLIPATAGDDILIDVGTKATTTNLFLTGNVTNYLQFQIQNRNNDTNASTDFVATAGNGNDTRYYIDMGINSLNYNVPAYNITGANDGYLYVQDGSLAIGTATAGKQLIFHTGGTTTANGRMLITDTGLLPYLTNAYSLGNTSNYWSALYSTNETIGNSTGNTTVTPTGTTFFGTAQPTDFLEIESLFTGTSPPATVLISTIGVSRTFDDGTDEQLYTHVKMPSRFAGGNVVLRYTWLSTTATTGNCVWAVEYRVYNDNELQSGGTANLSETQTTKGTTYNRTTTLGFTIPNVEPTDTLELRIYRDANAGADTLVGDAYLLHTTIEFPISTI